MVSKEDMHRTHLTTEDPTNPDGDSIRRNIIAVSPICGSRRGSRRHNKKQKHEVFPKQKPATLSNVPFRREKDLIDISFSPPQPSTFLTFDKPTFEQVVENIEANVMESENKVIRSKNDDLCFDVDRNQTLRENTQLVLPSNEQNEIYEKQATVVNNIDDDIKPQSDMDKESKESCSKSERRQSLNSGETEAKEPSMKLKNLVKRLSDTVETISKEKNSIEYILHQSYRTLKSSQGERVLEALSCQLLLNKQKTGVMTFNNFSFDEPQKDINVKKPIPLIEVSRQKTECLKNDCDQESRLSNDLSNNLAVSARRQTNASCGTNRITFEQWVALKNEQYRRHSIGISQIKKHEEKMVAMQRMNRCKRRMSYADWLEEKNRTINENRVKLMNLRRIKEEEKEYEKKRLEHEREAKYNEWLSKKYDEEIEREKNLLMKIKYRREKAKNM